MAAGVKCACRTVRLSSNNSCSRSACPRDRLPGRCSPEGCAAAAGAHENLMQDTLQGTVPCFIHCSGAGMLLGDVRGVKTMKTRYLAASVLAISVAVVLPT